MKTNSCEEKSVHVWNLDVLINRILVTHQIFATTVNSSPRSVRHRDQIRDCFVHNVVPTKSSYHIIHI